MIWHSGCAVSPSNSSGIAAYKAPPLIVTDFGNQSASLRVPPGMISVVGSDLGQQNASVYSVLQSSGVSRIRLDADVPNVFQKSTPDWTKLDPLLATVRNSGMQHVMLVFGYSPTWLQPQPDTCKLPWAAAPSDLGAYASIATAYVEHLDQQFPGLVDTYEIWNEPDTNFYFCVPNPGTNAVPTYLAIYSAVGAAIRAQSSKDGFSVRIGGPTISTASPPRVTAWVQRLLSEPSTAPYVDFISFHHYINNTALGAYTSPQNGLEWDTTTPSVLSLTLDSAHSVTGAYARLSAAIQGWTRRGASPVPILLTEYNMGGVSCCLNSPSYSPVWNMLVIADLFNSVQRGRSQMPETLSYFTVSGPSFQMCLFGTLDSTMNCKLSSDLAGTPYPQYYALALLDDRNYLDMGEGGTLAASVSVSPAYPKVFSTAFSTQRQNSVLIVNTGPDAVDTVPVAFQNVAFPPQTTVRVHLLNNDNTQITTSTVPLTYSGNQYVVSISLPPYSVVGLVIQPR